MKKGHPALVVLSMIVIVGVSFFIGQWSVAGARHIDLTTQSVARLSVAVLEKDDSEITQKPGAEIKATETVKPKYILKKILRSFISHLVLV